MNNIPIEININTIQDKIEFEDKLTNNNVMFVVEDKDIEGPYASMTVNYSIIVSNSKNVKLFKSLLSIFQEFSSLKPRITPKGEDS